MSLLFRFPPVNAACATASAFLVFSLITASGSDWPSLRGPDHNGISSETGIKTSGELPVAWKAEVDLGYSAIVVADGHAYTLGHDGKNQDTIWCFDTASGDVVWKHSYEHPLDDLYFPGGTTSTPTVDGGHLYSVARRGQLFCLDAKTGAVVWQKHLTDDFGCRMPDWGFTGAPRVFGNLLLLNAGEAGLAIDKKDGSVVWQSDASVESGYSTPYLFERGGKTLGFFSSKNGYTCLDVSNGSPLWFYKHKTRYGVNATEPIFVSDDLIFLSTGYDKGSAALKWDGTGEPVEVWRSRDYQNQMNTSLLIDGRLYGMNGNEDKDGTGLVCLNPTNGDIVWSEPSTGHGALTAAGSDLIVLTQGGELQIGPASADGFKPTLRQQVLGPKCWTVPVLANGQIYCRNGNGQVVVLKSK